MCLKTKYFDLRHGMHSVQLIVKALILEHVKTLDRFTAAGLTAEYYCCDVANRDSVNATLELIRAEMGPITGLIHGANDHQVNISINNN